MKTSIAVLLFFGLHFMAFAQEDDEPTRSDSAKWEISISTGFCSQTAPNFPGAKSKSSSLLACFRGSIRINKALDIFAQWNLSQFPFKKSSSKYDIDDTISPMPVQMVGAGISIFLFGRRRLQPFLNLGVGTVSFGSASFVKDNKLIFSTESKSAIYYQIGGGLKITDQAGWGAKLELNNYAMNYPGSFSSGIILPSKVNSFQVAFGLFKEF